MDKGQKIEELEEEIEKMKKENSEEINTMKYMNDSNIGLIKEERKENNESNEILEIGGFENVIYNLFNKQKMKFLNEIKNIKNEIISEIKEGLKKEDDINNKNLDEILTNINKINSNLKNHNININNIQSDLSNINEKLKDKNKEENAKNFENNNINDLTDFCNGDKIYECSNCKNLYCLNECFETKGNKKYNEHSLKLQKSNIEENVNNIKEKEEINIIEDYFNENIKNEEHPINNNIINEDNKEDNNFEIDVKLNEILNKYFYKNGKLISDYPFENIQNEVKGVYKTLLENNIDIKYIKDYQNNYIKVGVKPKINSLFEKQKKMVNIRIKNINDIINNLEKNWK